QRDHPLKTRSSRCLARSDGAAAVTRQNARPEIRPGLAAGVRRSAHPAAGNSAAFCAWHRSQTQRGEISRVSHLSGGLGRVGAVLEKWSYGMPCWSNKGSGQHEPISGGPSSFSVCLAQERAGQHDDVPVGSKLRERGGTPPGSVLHASDAVVGEPLTG